MTIRIRKETLVCMIAAIVFIVAVPRSFPADLPPPSNNALIQGMNLEEIIARLDRNNQQRALALHSYVGKRSYSLSYHGITGSHDAELEVVAHYQAPESKSFDVISRGGSKVLQSKVLEKLLESEREAAQAQNQIATALTPENYSFTLLGSRPSPYGGCYRLGVQPKRENKFLYRGEICVNAADFAVETVNAEPAKNPSFWTKKTRIEHRYQKIGQFWLPAFNQTVTSVRLGGTATLNIVYSSYELH